MNYRETDFLGISNLNVLNNEISDNLPGKLDYKGIQFGDDVAFFDYYLYTLIGNGYINEQDFDHRGGLVLEEFTEAYPEIAIKIFNKYKTETLEKQGISFDKEVAKEAKDVALGGSGKQAVRDSEVR